MPWHLLRVQGFVACLKPCTCLWLPPFTCGPQHFGSSATQRAILRCSRATMAPVPVLAVPEVQRQIARLLPVHDFLGFLLAGSPAPGAGQEHRGRIQQVLDAKRLVRELLDSLLCRSFGIFFLEDPSGFVLCWNPQRLSLEAFVRLRYNARINPPYPFRV